MNTKLCMLFMLVVCIAGFVSANPQGGTNSCGENEEFTTCGTACPPTCDQSNSPNFCTLQCIVGCQCKSGYVLNNQGKCVLRSDC